MSENFTRKKSNLNQKKLDDQMLGSEKRRGLNFLIFTSQQQGRLANVNVDE